MPRDIIPFKLVCKAEAIMIPAMTTRNSIPRKIPRKAIPALCVLGGLAFVMPRTDAAAVRDIDACSLLQPAEISSVIGMPVEDGVRKDEGLESNGSYSSACIWTIKRAVKVPEDPSAPFGGKSFVILNAMQWPAGSGLAHSFLEAFRTAARHGEIPNEPTPRQFGDEALWWGDGLAVRRHDVSFGVSVFIPDLDSQAHAGAFEEKLAPYILQRIERRESQPSGNARDK